MDSIVAPIGGFVNHIRWLLLLSEKYNNWTNLSIRVKPVFPFKLSKKVEYIENYIYPKERTAYNWLTFEWTYRTPLRDSIPVGHNMFFIENKCIKPDQENKTVVIDCPSDISLYHYHKINPGLTGYNKKDYLEFIDTENHINLTYKTFPKHQTFHIKAKDVYTEVLNIDAYQSIIDFFGVENNYEHANYLHQIWYKKSEEEIQRIITFCKTSTFPEFPWDRRLEQYKPKTVDEWNEMRDNLLQTYESTI